MTLSTQFVFVICLGHVVIPLVCGNIQPTCSLDCHHGQCQTRTTGEHYCKCEHGWLGNRCQTEDACHPRPCHNGGICHQTLRKPHFRCECVNNYAGDICQDKLPLNNNGSFTLAPQTGYHDDKCVPNPCHHHGICHHTRHSPFFRCECIYSYTGDLCEIPPCMSSPCHNNGICHNRKNGFHCECPHGYHGSLCEERKSTTNSLPPSVSTTISFSQQSVTKTPDPVTSLPVEITHSTTKTSQPSAYHACDKYDSVFGVAEKVIEMHPNASECSSGIHSSPDAYVLAHCDVNHTSLWKQGTRVMDNCDNIPSYTPIASFDNGVFKPSMSFSGIFLGCLRNETGIKLIMQHCDVDPAIVHITRGQFNFNPYFYFTII